MKKVFLACFFMSLLFGTASAGALEVTPTTVYGGGPVVQKIHIQGIVPYMRVIYIDAHQKIVRVVGNTNDNNVKVTVSYAGKNTPAKMTPYIYDQYQQLLADNSNQLKPGVTYYPKPEPADAAIGASFTETGNTFTGVTSTIKIATLKLAAY